MNFNSKSMSTDTSPIDRQEPTYARISEILGHVNILKFTAFLCTTGYNFQ